MVAADDKGWLKKVVEKTVKVQPVRNRGYVYA